MVFSVYELTARLSAIYDVVKLLLERLGVVKPEDQRDLADLGGALLTAGTDEDRKEIISAIREILDQKPMTVRSLLPDEAEQESSSTEIPAEDRGPSVIATSGELPRNPCLIRSFPANFWRRMRSYEPFSLPDAEVSELGMQVRANAESLAKLYRRGCEILHTQGAYEACDYLTFCLIPEYGLNDPMSQPAASRIGGIPDLSGMLGSGDSLMTRWPRCGCCHQPLSFVGQFDLVSWLPALHTAFGWFDPQGVKQDEYSWFSAVGSFRAVNHNSLFAQRLWQLFVCPLSSEHSDNPNSDAVILVNKRYLGKPEPTTWADTVSRVEEFVACYPRLRLIQRESVNADATGFRLKPAVISRYRFRLQLDDYLRQDFAKGYDLVRTLEKSYSDVFQVYPTRFQLFGAPYSQQTPQRFVSPFAHSEPRAMTPFTAFHAEDEDFSYQVYADTQHSNDSIIYGKVDGSCT